MSTAALADSMQAFLPGGLSALSSIVRNWTFSLFYLMSELWGSVVVSVLVSGGRARPYARQTASEAAGC